MCTHQVAVVFVKRLNHRRLVLAFVLPLLVGLRLALRSRMRRPRRLAQHSCAPLVRSRTLLKLRHAVYVELRCDVRQLKTETVQL